MKALVVCGCTRKSFLRVKRKRVALMTRSAQNRFFWHTVTLVLNISETIRRMRSVNIVIESSWVNCTDWDAVWWVDSCGFNASYISRECSLAPPGEYDWTMGGQRRNGLTDRDARLHVKMCHISVQTKYENTKWTCYSIEILKGRWQIISFCNQKKKLSQKTFIRYKSTIFLIKYYETIIMIIDAMLALPGWCRPAAV